VRVKLFGTLRRNFPDYPEEGMDVDVPEGVTAEGLFARLDIAPKGGIVSPEGVTLKPDASLPQGASVSIFQPVSGG
jgi:sulfur carrier protein ThiS